MPGETIGAVAEDEAGNAESGTICHLCRHRRVRMSAPPSTNIPRDELNCESPRSKLAEAAESWLTNTVELLEAPDSGNHLTACAIAGAGSAFNACL